MRERAEKGNDFIHFTIRAIEAAICARESSGRVVRLILEHPEDLGAAFQEGKFVGNPASIWQLPQIRGILERCKDFATVAGHQCQFEVNYSKPTRLVSDLPDLGTFGRLGWPVMRADGS